MDYPIIICPNWLYTHLFTKLFPEQGKAMGMGEVKLEPNEENELLRLKQWIFKEREKRERERAKEIGKGNTRV